MRRPGLLSEVPMQIQPRGVRRAIGSPGSKKTNSQVFRKVETWRSRSSFKSSNSMRFLYFGSLFFFPGQDPKSLKSVSGFSLIRLRSKVTEDFWNCEKNKQNERTEMAFKGRIFRIIEFPDRCLLIINFFSILPNLTEIDQSLLSCNSWKSVPSKRKLKFEKITFEKNFRYTNKYRLLTPLWEISVLVFQSNRFVYHFVDLRCLLDVDFVILTGKTERGLKPTSSI